MSHPRRLRSALPAAVLLAAALPCALAGCGPVAPGLAAARPTPTAAPSGPTAPATSTSDTASPSAAPSKTPATATAAPSTAPSPTTVATPPGALVVAAPGTVAQALAAAGRQVPGGRLLSAVDRHPLGPDGVPGRVLRDGAALQPADPVAAGDVLTLVPGADRVEAVTTSTEAVAGTWPAGLYTGGTPGRAVVTRGSVSGELVASRMTLAPVPGHLAHPGTVQLTFDDGPDPTWTPQVLALLAAHHVHAVFCQIGLHAAANPQLVKAVVAAGDPLCDHTWDHDERLPSRAPARIHDDVDHGRVAITAASGGVAPLFFRAPGGAWSPAVLAEARAEHLTPLYWNVDPRDWSRPGVAQILATVWQQLRPGGTILLHDGGGDRSQTLAALRVLLDELPAAGYVAVLPAG